MLDTVVGFAWTDLPSSGKPLILIQLTWERTRRPGPLVKDDRRIITPVEAHTESLMLTLRGGGGVGW